MYMLEKMLATRMSSHINIDNMKSDVTSMTLGQDQLSKHVRSTSQAHKIDGDNVAYPRGA